MPFESWKHNHADKVRRNRLIFGYVIGASTVGAGIAFVVLTSSANVAAQEEEEAKVVEVQIAKEPEPEPEPEPPPPPDPKQHFSNPGPRLPKLETPTAITNDKVEEKDVKPSTGTGTGDPYEKGGGDGSGTGQKAVVEAPAAPPPPPPPKVNKPRPVSETDVPPEMIGAAVNPEYPADVKAAGIEGTVVVRYIVTETGEVKDVKAVKGPPELFAVSVAAVRALRFKAAHDAEGHAISVVKYKTFHYRIRT